MEIRTARYLRRLAAVIIDNQIFNLLLLIPFLIYIIVYPPNQIIPLAIHIVTFYFCVILLWFIVSLLYQAYMTHYYGGTIGKLLMGLRVVKYDTNEKIDLKTALWRYSAGYAFSSQLLGLGFWRIVKSPERLGWHDELFNTKVIVVRSYKLGLLLSVLLFIFSTALFSYTIYTGLNKFFSARDMHFSEPFAPDVLYTPESTNSPVLKNQPFIPDTAKPID